MSLLIMTVVSQQAAAQGDLLITPRRLVFEGSVRSMDINLANIGDDSATYAVSLIQIRMLEDGGFATITEPDPGQRFADRYLRFFPRLVNLGPNETQVVKVQLTRIGDLTTGEYRSHFYFRAIPKINPLGAEVKTSDSSAISVQLTPIFGITIPAIIRVGNPEVKVNLSDLSLDITTDTIPVLNLRFNRTGNMSVYGDLTVDHISTQGKVTRVGVANGIAVYTPNTGRRFRLPLTPVRGIDFRTGTLRAIYTSSSDVTPVRLAEAELPLSQ